jgi:hypothetical protein
MKKECIRIGEQRGREECKCNGDIATCECYKAGLKDGGRAEALEEVENILRQYNTSIGFQKQFRILKNSKAGEDKK